MPSVDNGDCSIFASDCMHIALEICFSATNIFSVNRSSRLSVSIECMVLDTNGLYVDGRQLFGDNSSSE